MAEITLSPTIKQDEAWNKLQDNNTKFILFGGGAGGGKSWLGCEWELVNAYLYPGYKGFIGRNELKRLMSSTFVTFQKVCRHHKIPAGDWKLNGQYNYIEFKNGSRIDLLDVAYKPSDPLYERFGSTEFSNGWLEEAGETNFLAFDVLKSRIGRHLNKELKIPTKLFASCNPKKNWLYQIFYKPWKLGTLPANYAFIQALYGDNPHTSHEYAEMLSEIKDPSTKQRLMFGNWEYDDDPNSLVDYDAILDLFTNTVEHEEERYYVADIARYGGDKIVKTFWQGMKCYKIKVSQRQGLDVTADEIRDDLRAEKIPYSHCLVDESGLGGGVVDTLRGIKGFVGNSSPLYNPDISENVNPASITGSKVKSPENYRNLKAQCGYMLAEAINKHEMAIECDDEKIRQQIIEEVEYLKAKDVYTDGKYELKQKDEIIESLGHSPDFLDTLLMRMYFKLDRTAKKKTNQFNKTKNTFR